MTDLVVFGASCVVVGLAAGVLIGLWAPPPRRREARVPEHPSLLSLIASDGSPCSTTNCTVTATEPRYLTLVPPPAQFVDAEALGWLEGA